MESRKVTMAATPSKKILAAYPWSSNGALIAAVHKLGYLRDEDHVLDPTYGSGGWWTHWRPAKLTTFCRAKDGSDFRNLPVDSRSYDAVAFDPPYVCPGGRRTSTIKKMHDQYGMNEGGCDDPEFRTPAELQRIINDGLTEMARVVKPARTMTGGGIVLVKCMNYIWSGKLWEGAELIREHARSLGLVVVDRLEMLKAGGPQPANNLDGSPRRQVHASRNLSTLFVLRKLPQR